MTQPQMIGHYIIENGSIVPASLIGGYYMGRKWPAELSKRCRELRAKSILISPPESKVGSMERFYFHPYLVMLLRAGKKINILHDYNNEINLWESQISHPSQVESKAEVQLTLI